MNTGQILQQSWVLLGEPSDLNPNTAQGRIYLLQGLNEAVKAVASYKDKVTGHFFNFNQFRAEAYLSYNIYTGTADAASTDQTVILANLPSGDTDISGAILTINGENRVIMSNTGVTCIVAEPFSNTASGESYTLRKRWINIPDSIDYIEVLKVEDLTNSRELTRAGNHEVYLNSLETTGTPGNWYRIGKRIYMDVVPSTAFTMRIWYYRMPAEVVVNSNVPELPSNFHFGIVLWTVYWGYQWMQEPNDAYAAQRRFEEFMRTRQSQNDVKDSMNQEFQLTIRI